MEIPQKELDFIASFKRFTIAPTENLKPKIEPEPFHKEFHLFNNLLPEIRNQIWDLTLPGPRIILINQVKAPKDPDAVPYTPENVEYVASPCSYGGAHPIALSICRESRGQALRKLTERFHAYWNMEQDAAYLDGKGRVPMIERLVDMRVKGLFDGFKKVAADMDIWHSENCEPLPELLRKCPQISHLYFICRWQKFNADILVPGVSWFVIDADSEEQTEFKEHKHWCLVIMTYQKKMMQVVEKDIKEYEAEWAARAFQPVIEMKIIAGRKMKDSEFD